MKLAVLGVLLTAAAGAQPPPGTCLSADELALARSLNDYRRANGLPPVPFSRSLTTVAQWHVIDLEEHEFSIAPGHCNAHSWSSDRPDLWSEVCVTAPSTDAQQAGMTAKPAEITAVYQEPGYEIVAWRFPQISAETALQGWQQSVPHDQTILNQGGWSSLEWRAMGVALSQRYAAVWFGAVVDPQGTISGCEQLLFRDDFD